LLLCSSAPSVSTLPKLPPKSAGWELKNGEWVRRLKDPLAAADAGDGADSGCAAFSFGPSSSFSPTRAPFNLPSSMLIARRTIPAGESLGSYSGALSSQTAPPMSVRGHDDTKVRRDQLTAST